MVYNKYNELDYAKFVYENGIQKINHIKTELRLVATYMRIVLKQKPREQSKNMYEWCEKNIPEYNINKHYAIIKKALKQSRKKNVVLTNLKKVEIYDYELDYINNCKILNTEGNESKFSYEAKKVMFTLLIKLKINKYISELKNNKEDFQYTGKSFKGGQKKYSEIKKEAKLKNKTMINEDIISDLISSKLVTALYGGIIILNFMDDIYELQETNKNNNIKPIITVTDFESIGWYYDRYYGDKTIKECENCGKLVKIRSKYDASTKYCSECAIIVDRQKAKERMREIRNKNVRKL